MGRRADLRPKNGRQVYEAKIRRPGDRVDFNGNKVEGGKIFSRHFEANNTAHAERVATRIAKKNGGRIVSLAKVDPQDIIGDFSTWGLRDIIGGPKPERRRSEIREDSRLDDFIYKRK